MEQFNQYIESILLRDESYADRLFPVKATLSTIRAYSEPLEKVMACYEALSKCSFDEIKTSQKHRKSLAKLLAHTWLISRTRTDTIYRFCLPFSVLLDQPYVFELNYETLFFDLFSRPIQTIEYPKPIFHSVKYEERLALFPDLENLQNLSLATKLTFALLIFKADAISGILSTEDIPNLRLFKDDISILEQKGLISANPSDVDLLATFGYEDLKRFAQKHDIYIFKKRDDLINEISQKISESEIRKFIRPHLEIVKPLMPKIKQMQVLRKFMLEESNRLSIYLEWVALKLCGIPSVVAPLLVKRTLPGDVIPRPTPKKKDYHKNLYRSEGSFLNYYSKREIEIIKSFWDSYCDKVIAEEPVFDDGVKKLAAYMFEIGAVEYFIKSLGKDKKLWRSIFAAFVSSKYRKKYKPSPQLLTCNGCGAQFREYSVSWRLIQCVNGNVQFCQFCYEEILNHDYCANNAEMEKQDNAKMLENLHRLYVSLERIPTLELLKNIPTRIPSHPTEKQIAVGKSLLVMPSQLLYVKRFGSWLKSLEMAGILEGGYRKTARGIQVFANDGHICLSLAEKVVDDWLNAHHINHEKEPKYPFHIEFNPRKLMRADWKIEDTFIEYAGLMEDYEYALKMVRKKSLAESLNLDVIVLSEKDLDNLSLKLERLLTR
ncbi:MAG: hypothetical protein HOP27_15620 [Anaerolineales bacterium]|nr:hypothetical protein [Anaerolineales bacterium]